MKNSEYQKKYKRKNPWAKHLTKARARCLLSGNYSYYSRGIKCKLNIKEIKELWFKYNADLMVRPELHRKKDSADYTFENCVFIEKEKHQIIHGKSQGNPRVNTYLNPYPGVPTTPAL